MSSSNTEVLTDSNVEETIVELEVKSNDVEESNLDAEKELLKTDNSAKEQSFQGIIGAAEKSLGESKTQLVNVKEGKNYEKGL